MESSFAGSIPLAWDENQTFPTPIVFIQNSIGIQPSRLGSNHAPFAALDAR